LRILETPTGLGVLLGFVLSEFATDIIWGYHDLFFL
jgi:hypothetical protein